MSEPTKSDKLLLAGASLPFTEALSAVVHGGPIGGIVALGASALIYVVAEEIENWTGREISLPRPTRRNRQPGGQDIMYKLFNGKSVREARDEDDSSWIPPQFLVDDVLDTIAEFNDQHNSIYFGESEDGAVAIPLSKMYHVIDVSPSGNGKSNRLRLGMMQLVNNCECYFINPIAASVKGVDDDREVEVWKPIFDRLANKRPMKTGDEIETLLKNMAREIKRRNDLEEQGDLSWMDNPIFVFVDELPEVFSLCPNAVKLLDKIGRAGRQFLVFCWVAAQTALVEEIGQSTATQAQYKTRLYGGGDKTSANRLMKGSIADEIERALQTSGAGLTLMLATGMSGPSLVRDPLITNEGLFDFLELGEFRKEDWIKDRRTRRPRRQIEDDDDAFSFSLGRHPSRTFPARNERVRDPFYENESLVKEPLEDDERGESLNERGETFIPSHEDEIAVLMTALQLQGEGLNVSREAIKQRLGWNNAKHPVVKFVCDKHKIAVR
jgi:hypothetical protein